MRRVIALTAAAAALGGCFSIRVELAGRAWTRPDTTIRRVTLDEMDCARQARETPRAPGSLLGGLADIAPAARDGARITTAFEGCMMALGYAPAAGR